MTGNPTYGKHMLTYSKRRIGASREQALREKEAEEGDDVYDDSAENADVMDL